MRPGVLMALLFVFALASVAAGSAASASQSVVAGTACIDPVVHDSYDGFHVGVPKGWFVSSLDGLVVVFKDYSATTEGVVQTAYVNKGESSKVFLSRIMSSIAKNAHSAGNTLNFRLAGPSTAAVTGQVGSTAISGQASVSFAPVASAHGSEVGIVSGYWAPTSQLGGERRELASIGACYGPERGTLSRFVKDSAFGYTLPLGWTVGNEGSDELFLDDGPNASANFLLAGPFLQSSTGITNTATFQQYCLGKLGINVSKVLSNYSFPASSTASGGTEQEMITEFLGTIGSKPIHGLVRTIASVGGGVSSGVLRIALTTPGLWNSLNGAVIAVSYGIEHNFTQDLAAIRQQQQQLAGFAQQVAGFDQALNGTDIVENPATGEQFEAPYSAYDQNGPNGPGYYSGTSGNLTKLKIITPS